MTQDDNRCRLCVILIWLLVGGIPREVRTMAELCRSPSGRLAGDIQARPPHPQTKA